MCLMSQKSYKVRSILLFMSLLTKNQRQGNMQEIHGLHILGTDVQICQQHASLKLEQGESATSTQHSLLSNRLTDPMLLPQPTTLYPLLFKQAAAISTSVAQALPIEIYFLSSLFPQPSKSKHANPTFSGRRESSLNPQSLQDEFPCKQRTTYVISSGQYSESGKGETFVEISIGDEQIFIIKEAWRTNQQICKLLYTICGLVIFQLVRLDLYNLLLFLLVCYFKQHIIISLLVREFILLTFIIRVLMLNYDIRPSQFQVPEGVWSISQWLPFHLYEWLPRFPRFAPNPFMLNHPSYFYYEIAWHSKYPVVFPHSYSYRMLRAIATNKMSEIVQLLEKGFPIDHVVDKKYGYNSLQIAAMTNHFPLIELLVLRGADIDKKDHLGNTPLMIAVANQNHQAIHSLLRNGSDITAKNRYGLTAIDKADDIPSIKNFLINFNQKRRNFPRFIVKLRLQKMLRNPFWDQVKSMKIYTNKVTQNPLSRWQFDFTDYRQISQLQQHDKDSKAKKQ